MTPQLIPKLEPVYRPRKPWMKRMLISPEEEYTPKSSFLSLSLKDWHLLWGLTMHWEKGNDQIFCAFLLDIGSEVTLIHRDPKHCVLCQPG